MRFAAWFLVLLFVMTKAEVFYKDTFKSVDDFKGRWVQSSWKKASGEAGAFKISAGDFYGNKDDDLGLQTSQDARFYAYTSALEKPFSNKDKTLVLQFSVKHGQKIDCGGGYIKLLPPGTDQVSFSGDSPYNVMFGPDVCGATKRVHVIFNYKGQNKLIKKDIPCETDQLTHVYTLIVKPDQTYEVRIDGTKKESGSLLEDWDFLAPQTIADPSITKPADWVDEPLMDDPSDVKPADWDSVPKQIADPEASKPEDWDDEADGEWEPPMIDNPEWKGDWKPKRISNPNYKGKWVQPTIPNPEYVEDKNIYAFENGAVGFDLWQVKAGTVFDNIIVTDSIAEAEAFMEQTYAKNKDAEKRAFDQIEAKKREQEEIERKKLEQAKKESEDSDDEDDEDDDDKDEL